MTSEVLDMSQRFGTKLLRFGSTPICEQNLKLSKVG
jgi:hypothetical protein